MLKWCYGHRSAIDVNADAVLAWKAGARGGYLQKLARLGAGGTNPQNCSQDLMALIRKLLGQMIVPLYITLIPLFVAKSISEDGKPSPERCPVGFILPHVWFLVPFHTPPQRILFAVLRVCGVCGDRDTFGLLAQCAPC
jgi:hypothetical protein